VGSRWRPPRTLDLRAWPETPWIVDVLQSCLTRASCGRGALSRTGETSRARFVMFESLREYTSVKLRETGAIPRRQRKQGGSAAEERRALHARFGTQAEVDRPISTAALRHELRRGWQL
jgi:hypothetical protein